MNRTGDDRNYTTTPAAPPPHVPVRSPRNAHAADTAAPAAATMAPAVAPEAAAPEDAAAGAPDVAADANAVEGLRSAVSVNYEIVMIMLPCVLAGGMLGV